jgi:hypothetical protein
VGQEKTLNHDTPRLSVQAGIAGRRESFRFQIKDDIKAARKKATKAY